MAYKPNEIGRLTLKELLDYRDNSGITTRQYYIIKRKFYDSDRAKAKTISEELNVGTTTYNIELKKALAIIKRYEQKKNS